MDLHGNFFRRFRRGRPQEDLSGDRWRWILEHHPILAGLSLAELETLRGLATDFLRLVTFEPARGLELTGEMRAVVAVQAGLPVLRLGLEWYAGWKTVVLVPGEFTGEHQELDAAGVVHEWEEQQSGEAWEEGPVVLSWADVEQSGWGDGYNVVIHEAAHRLDLLDGSLNGRPALHEGMSGQEWFEVFSASFERFTRRGRKSGIDPYAGENDAEFFAVTSEYFFERPRRLRRELPEVYRLLAAFYRQDPAARLPGR